MHAQPPIFFRFTHSQPVPPDTTVYVIDHQNWRVTVTPSFVGEIPIYTGILPFFVQAIAI